MQEEKFCTRDPLYYPVPLNLRVHLNITIKKDFVYITGFDLLPRIVNLMSDGVERKDSLLKELSIFYFSEPQKFKKLKQKIKKWLKQEQTETLFSLAGYLYYIINDFHKAKRFFLKSIAVSPDNIDNWMDLSFALRHLGEYAVSNGILFYFDYVIYYYKFLGLDGDSYASIKKLVLEITRRINNKSN